MLEEDRASDRHQFIKLHPHPVSGQPPTSRPAAAGHRQEASRSRPPAWLGLPDGCWPAAAWLACGGWLAMGGGMGTVRYITMLDVASQLYSCRASFHSLIEARGYCKWIGILVAAGDVPFCGSLVVYGEIRERVGDVKRLLITMPWGIGDAIVVGLSAVDQIRCNDPAGEVEIDVLCNQVQREIFAEDARIHRVIEVDRELFPLGATGIWKRGVFLSAEQVKLAQFLRAQSYAAVLPFLFAPTFFYCLHLPVMFFNPWQAWRIMARLRALEDAPMQMLIRGIINKYAGKKALDFTSEATIPLYICPEHVLKARRTVAWIRAQVGMPQGWGKLLMVAPDTSSVITRPPTRLLAEGIAAALRRDHSLLVVILPGYTDVDAAPRLEQALLPAFPGRVFLLPAEPAPSLLELAALIDQCDLFVSGDTGVMHLAAATKRLASASGGACEPRNTVKIISLFGGTNPALHGYSKRSIILGRGRKEQTRIAPGVMKDLYDPAGKNLFDHIVPQELTDAICSSLQDREEGLLASS